MSELDTITVRGFRSIAAIETLKLEPINILIGANGSGKSNFIGVFSFLQAIREGRLQEYVTRSGGADRLLHFGSRKTPQLSVDIWFDSDSSLANGYQIVLSGTETDQLAPTKEIVSFWDRSKYPGPYLDSLPPARYEAGISNDSSEGISRIARYVREHLVRWRLYHFHDTSAASPLKATADIDDNRFLRSDGANLAAFLFLLKQRYEPSYGLIRKTVQRVAPFFDDFVLEPQRLNPQRIRLEWRHTKSDAYFDASAFSDGTLRFIALATLFLQPADFRPSVILVDEPELGLHPKAITMLASLVKQSAVSTQVIVSTQSPLLVDHFQPEDVLVATRAEGATSLSRLDPTELEPWLEDYSLGQLWEKNEFGGRPTGD